MLSGFDVPDVPTSWATVRRAMSTRSRRGECARRRSHPDDLRGSRGRRRWHEWKHRFLRSSDEALTGAGRLTLRKAPPRRALASGRCEAGPPRVGSAPARAESDGVGLPAVHGALCARRRFPVRDHGEARASRLAAQAIVVVAQGERRSDGPVAGAGMPFDRKRRMLVERTPFNLPVPGVVPKSRHARIAAGRRPGGRTGRSSRSPGCGTRCESAFGEPVA